MRRPVAGRFRKVGRFLQAALQSEVLAVSAARRRGVLQQAAQQQALLGSVAKPRAVQQRAVQQAQALVVSLPVARPRVVHLRVVPQLAARASVE